MIINLRNIKKQTDMKLAFILLLLLSSHLLSLGQGNQITTKQFKEDFNYFITNINDEYCYFEKKQINWQVVKEIYSRAVDTITTRDEFVTILEKAFNEIYDHHAVLNTNTNKSQRLVPSGTDIWAEYINGKPIITESGIQETKAKAGKKVPRKIVTDKEKKVAKEEEEAIDN